MAAALKPSGPGGETSWSKIFRLGPLSHRNGRPTGEDSIVHACCIEVMISDCSYFVWLQVDQLLIKLKRRQTPSKDLAILTAEALRKVHNCLALRLFGTCLDTLSFS